MSKHERERNAKMVREIERGASLTLVGRAFGLSRQRVWSIYKDMKQRDEQPLDRGTDTHGTNSDNS